MSRDEARSADPKAPEPGVGVVWIEVEDSYLTNQPAAWVGRGKARKWAALPGTEPTEAYMFCWRCRRTKRGVARSRFLDILNAENGAALDRAIVRFCEDKVLIACPDDPISYEASRREPVPMPMEESA